jgi:hypothetical protein
MGYKKMYKQLLAEFEQYKKESIKWSVEDFTDYNYPTPTIDRESAQEALEHMIRMHDATCGITHETIEYYIELYKTKNSHEEIQEGI